MLKANPGKRVNKLYIKSKVNMIAEESEDSLDIPYDDTDENFSENAICMVRECKDSSDSGESGSEDEEDMSITETGNTDKGRYSYNGGGR